jgi:uncharacterized damage-inducible protein DinB
MTRVEELRELYAFNRWANEALLRAASRLTAEQLGRDLGSSFPSVLATLVHIAQADWVWLRRWHGESPTAPPPWDTSTLDAVRQHWARVQDEREAFLSGLSDADVDRVIAYRNLAGEQLANPLWQLLRHVVNHATYHRGQVTTLLRQLGAETVATDLVRWYRLERPAMPAE